MTEVKNIIAPPALEVSPTYLKIGKKFAKTLFIFAYPRYLSTGWFSPIVNVPELMDISIFFHPVDTATALKKLKKKTAQIEAQIIEQQEKGMVRNPLLETAYQDIENLRDALQQAREHLFSVGIYITIYANSIRELSDVEAKLSSILESRLIYAKNSVFQQLEGWGSVLPLGNDKLLVHTPLNSSPSSSIFPFLSAQLTGEDGILYGINRHDNTLIIFDRFSLENANMVVFAKSGAGKSYATKLEALRLLMMGADVLVIDPENEYENLAHAVGGSFFKINLASDDHINPFDIPIIPEDEDPSSVLKSHFLNLAGLIKLMIGAIKPEEESVLDQAITETYALRDIIPGKDFGNKEAPLLSDLEAVLRSLEGGKGMAQRLYRYTKGTYANFANQPSNVNLKNRLIVFSIRDLEEELRSVAMYMIVNYVWNLIKGDLKRRVMIIDEAWLLMKYPDGAAFLFGLVKRARKYFLGVTTITQDVEDFLSSPFGRPIITNSSLQLLLKQAPAMIETVAKAFNLSESEKNFILETAVGEGLFFAGLKHVVIQIIASRLEDKIITTKPQEIAKQK